MMYIVEQQIVNGNEIPYQIKGKGPLLVMIHGGGLDQKMWAPQVKGLAKKFRVLTYDLRGHGDYDLKDNSGYEIDDLKGILDEIKEDKIYLVGHSLGSMVATDFVLAYPEQVEKLVLMSPPLSGYFSDRKEIVDLLTDYEELMMSRGDDKKMDEAVDLLSKLVLLGADRKADAVDSEIYAYVRKSLEQHFETDEVFTPPVLKLENHLEQIKNIKQSTMLLYGELDYGYIKDNVAKLKQEIPSVRIHAIGNAAHLFNMEQADEVNQLLLDFLL